MPVLRPPVLRWILAVATASLLLTATARVQDRVAELKSQFSRESDPVRKAKALPKLGDAQFDRVRKEIGAENFSQALRIIEDYREEVRTTLAALKATGVDAERKPAGFKQLQLYVRKSLRELDQVVLALPEGQREPFEAVRRELLSVEKELLELLFPRQPGKSAEQQKPKG